MNRIVKGILIGCGAMALSAGAFAQDYGRPGERSHFQDRDRDRGPWSHERLAREYRSAFYDRLESDLNRAEHNRYLRGNDIQAFDRARKEVREFSAKWSRGVFDAREMDQAIGAVQRVVRIRSLHRDDRDALRQDLEGMRRFRARMENRR